MTRQPILAKSDNLVLFSEIGNDEYMHDPLERSSPPLDNFWSHFELPVEASLLDRPGYQ
jgi:hypothetical protein